MTRIQSFSIFFLFASLLLFSCGKKEIKEEYIYEKPVTEENTEKKTDTLNNDSTKRTQTSPTGSTKDKSTDIYEHEFHPVADVSALEAGDYIGKEIKVTGFVADVYKSDKVAYLNFIQKYPDNPFTAVIFANKFSNFGDLNKYERIEIEVTGRVSTFKGKPQMILDSPTQIKIVK